MDLDDGFRLDEPRVLVPWGLHEHELRSLVPNGHQVTDGYYVVECTSLGGLSLQLGLHFEPRTPQGRLVELEFFRRTYPDLQQSYDDFQARLEATFGPPTETSTGSWDEAMPTHRWSCGGATITHRVFDRFGPEEHVRIRRPTS